MIIVITLFERTATGGMIESLDGYQAHSEGAITVRALSRIAQGRYEECVGMGEEIFSNRHSAPKLYQ